MAINGAQCIALLVKGVITGGLLVFAGEAVGELGAVVGQQLADFERHGFVHPAQKVHVAALGLIAVNAQEHPACGAVNGHEQVAPATE